MIAVVGAGISGLAAAFELTRRGIPVQVFESTERVGGLIHTERWGGYTIDAGADSMLSAKPAAAALCEELGLASSLQTMQPPRTAYVLERSRLFPLPSPSVLGLPLSLRAAARFTLLRPRARARVALERYLPARHAAATMDDESVADLFRRRFGAATVRAIAQPLLGGIHAGDVERLSVRALFPSLMEAERRHGSVTRGLARRPSTRDGLFRSLAGGMSVLPEAIRASLPAGTIRVGDEVAAIFRDGGRWRVEATQGRVTADAIVCAAPLPASAGLIAPFEAEASSLLSGIHHASTVSVALAWPRAAVAHPLDGSGFVVARGDDRIRVTACSWVSSKWEGRAPADRVLLRAFLGGTHDEGAVDLDDDQVVTVATRDLSTVLGIRDEPEFSRVYRWRRASPQLVVGHIARVEQVEGRLARHPGLLLASRGFRAVGIPDCIAEGRRVAAAAADYSRRTLRA